MFGMFGALALLLGFNVLFVLMEYALLKVRSSRIELLARKGNPSALRVQEIIGHLDEYLAAIQVGITVVALALGAYAEPGISQVVGAALERILGDLPRAAVRTLSFALALGLLTFFQIVVGELMPRAVAIHNAEAIALWGSLPLKWFAAACRWPVVVMSQSSRVLLRLAGLKPAAESDSVVSEDEMRILLGETSEKGTLPLERLLLLENLFDLGTAKAAEAMVPAEKVAVLALKKPWSENLETIRSRRYSRYPLCEQGLESILGMVHVKDLVLKGEPGVEPDLRRLRREIAIVSEHDPLEKLLKSFPDKGIHMAVVYNAAGAPAGILTLEDIVEELIGEVHDEFDLPQAWSLMDVVAPAAVAVALASSTREEAIGELLSRLCVAHPELNATEAYNAVWEREKKLSSAVGRGVAVPHARMSGLVRPLVAVGRFAKSLPFPNPDGTGVRLVFLILTPSATPILQLKILARIASLATNENLRRKLMRAKTAEAMLEIMRTADTLLAA